MLKYLYLLLFVIHISFSLSGKSSLSRRLFVSASSASVASSLVCPPPVLAEGLGERLSKKDPSLLSNKIFNIPPSAQIYPTWLRGDWDVTSSFRGYLFPSSTIPKQNLIQNFVVPGFQKCSIAATADVGKESVEYVWRVDPQTGMEDRVSNFRHSINAYLGYRAVDTVIYNAKSNPNRLSIDFVDYKTVNAERVELFCNARESETYINANDRPVFVCSEYVRQVTFGTGAQVGIPRQVGTNYAHFWTFQGASPAASSASTSDEPAEEWTGNLLTAGYLDPQDSMYFQEPTRPVVVFSHNLVGKRRPG